MNKFWMVVRVAQHNPQPPHLRPSMRHFRATEAYDEAKRLAGVHIGEVFAVMEVKHFVRVPVEVAEPTLIVVNP